MVLARTTETPRYNKAYLEERYPGFTILGDRQGWFYPVEATRVVFCSVGWNSLVEDVRAHLKGNGLPVDPNLSLSMQEFWCREVSAENCSEPANPNMKDTVAMAERFLRTAKAFVFSGAEKVPQEEAERRAAICADCPMNVTGNFCTSCFMRNMVASTVAMVSGWKTSKDDKLKACGVCSCDLKIKVHVPKDQMNYKELDGLWAEKCWMRPTEALSASETQPPAETL
jgi:hypothetical protein